MIKTINQAYGISIAALEQTGPVWKAYTAKGIFCLRQMKAGPEKLRQLAKVLETIKKSGFPNLTTFIPSKNGEPFLKIADRYYILLKWFEGEHPLFTSVNHLQKVAKLLGKLHQVSKTIDLPLNWPLKDSLVEFRIRTDFLKNLITQLNHRETLNRIDRAIVKVGEHFLNQAEWSVQGLTDLNYRNWLLNTTEKGFCHNDPAPLNIIIQNQNWILIDFELAAYDAFIREFAIFSARALATNCWDSKTGDIIKSAYREERAVSKAELEFLPYLLCFPQRFWRLCSQRFEEKLDWTESHFWRKLWEINEDEKIRFPFLTNLLPQLNENANFI